MNLPISEHQVAASRKCASVADRVYVVVAVDFEHFVGYGVVLSAVAILGQVIFSEAILAPGGLKIR